jgi:hypothetical protein
MADNVIRDFGLEIARGAVQVSGQFLGRNMIDVFRKTLLTSGQKQQGDVLMDQSRELLQSHLRLLEHQEQELEDIELADIELADIKGHYRELV